MGNHKCCYPNAPNEIHFCSCGCRQQIPFKPYYRTRGYPKYLIGHLVRGRTAATHPYIAAQAEKRRGSPKVNRYPDIENQVVYCSCGCGQQITFKSHYRNCGYPKYLHGHSPRTRTCRYPDAQNEVHFCACGCGGQVTFRSHYRYYGYPKYLPYHQPSWNKGLCRYPDAENQVVYCACGCGQQIPFKPYYRTVGYSQVIHGHMSEEKRQQMSEASLGNKGRNWKGGISKEPYAFDFDQALKESIRQRDGYRCQNCGVPQMECRRKLDIHHTDYDKKNTSPSNLITLCSSCNGQANWNRDYWTKHFKTKLRQKKFQVLISWLPLKSYILKDSKR